MYTGIRTQLYRKNQVIKDGYNIFWRTQGFFTTQNYLHNKYFYIIQDKYHKYHHKINIIIIIIIFCSFSHAAWVWWLLPNSKRSKTNLPFYNLELTRLVTIVSCLSRRIRWCSFWLKSAENKKSDLQNRFLT